MLSKLRGRRLIHKEAIIHPTAILGPGVVVGPNCIVCEGARIGAYSVIGTMPEHRDFFDDLNGQRTLGVCIQKDARIFEFVSIQAGTVRTTVIEHGASVFNHAHVGHDSIVGWGASVGGGCSLAGHTTIMDHAVVSGHSCTFQHCVIGPYAFVGGMSYVTQNVPPAEKWLGIPARPAGLNEIGLKRHGIDYDTVLKKWSGLYHSVKERA